MPVGFGLACSHSPNVFIDAEDWDNRYKGAILDVPQPLAAAKETLEVRRAYKARIDAAFETLRKKLAEYRPDAIVMVTDDHNEMYDENLCQPSIAMFTGDTGSGTLTLKGPSEDPAGAPRVKVRCHRELAVHIAKELVQRDFDIAITRTPETHSIGARDRGMGHGFSRTAPKIMPELDIPTVLFWLNCYFEPLPTARRCLALGRAIADACRKRPERIAIFGTGGLSHDPRGPRAGWVDEPLDRSVLKAFAEGEPDRLSTLYTFDSDTFHGGTGEIRNWLVVGGAMGSTRATVVDYMAAHSAITGVGFAYWNPADGSSSL
jgi:protocatechuate 4,5-dioxygenase beta chain